MSYLNILTMSLSSIFIIFYFAVVLLSQTSGKTTRGWVVTQYPFAGNCHAQVQSIVKSSIILVGGA